MRALLISCKMMLVAVAMLIMPAPHARAANQCHGAVTIPGVIAEINACITTNGAHQITGAVVNGILNDIVNLISSAGCLPLTGDVTASLGTCITALVHINAGSVTVTGVFPTSSDPALTGDATKAPGSSAVTVTKIGGVVPGPITFLTIGQGLASAAGALELAPIADQNVLGNISGATAVPQAVPLGSIFSQITVTNIAALKALTPNIARFVWVNGYTAQGDGGQGWFYWNSASTAATDGGTIFVPNAGGVGRWIRYVTNNTYYIGWWGPHGDCTTDDTTPLTNAAATLNANGGTLIVNAPLAFNNVVTLASRSGININFTDLGKLCFIGSTPPASFVSLLVGAFETGINGVTATGTSNIGSKRVSLSSVAGLAAGQYLRLLWTTGSGACTGCSKSFTSMISSVQGSVVNLSTPLPWAVPNGTAFSQLLTGTPISNVTIKGLNLSAATYSGASSLSGLWVVGGVGVIIDTIRTDHIPNAGVIFRTGVANKLLHATSDNDGHFPVGDASYEIDACTACIFDDVRIVNAQYFGFLSNWNHYSQFNNFRINGIGNTAPGNRVHFARGFKTFDTSHCNISNLQIDGWSGDASWRENQSSYCTWSNINISNTIEGYLQSDDPGLVAETYTIGVTTPQCTVAPAYTCTMANASSYYTNVSVTYSGTGLPLTPVGGAPAVGQYSVTAGVYTFNVGDVGQAVTFVYQWLIDAEGMKSDGLDDSFNTFSSGSVRNTETTDGGSDIVFSPGDVSNQLINFIYDTYYSLSDPSTFNLTQILRITSSVYTTLADNQGVAGILLGNSVDPIMYFRRGQYTFQNQAGSSTFALLGSGGLGVGSSGTVGNPTSTIDSNGTIGWAIGTFTGASVSPTVAFGTLNCSAAAGNQTITLPTGATVSRRMYVIKKVDATANTCIISGTIDGVASITLSTQYDSVMLQYDGSQWWQLYRSYGTTLGTMAFQAASAVAITGGTINGTTLGASTPAAGTFTQLTATNTVSLSPAGATVTISPTGAGTLTAAPATLGSIDNVQIGQTTAVAGKFTTLQATGTVTLSPANLNVTIAPTGTGTIGINPAGVGSLDNVTLGATTPKSVVATSLTVGISSSVQGQIFIKNNGGAGIVTFQAPSSATVNYNFNLPATSPTSGQVMAAAGGGTNTAGTWITLATVATSGSASDLGSGTLPAARLPTAAITGGTIDGTTLGATVPSSGVFTTLTGTTLKVTNTFASSTAPSVNTGFCTSPSISANNGTKAFQLTIGSGCAGSTGTLTMPAASTAWVCKFVNQTNNATSDPEQTGGTTTTVTVQNYVRTTGVAGNFTSADVVRADCDAY